MKKPQAIPRVVLGADVILTSLILPASPAAQLFNIVLEGNVIPVIDSRLSSIYAMILKCDDLNLPRNLIRDMLLKLSRISDIISPSPFPYLSEDLPPEDVLYFQIAFSAGTIPVIKSTLHYYLNSSLAKTIPLFTPAGFIKELQHINACYQVV